MASSDWERILGVRFFYGAAPEAVDYITRVGGYTVVPAAPALVKIENDPTYRCALVEADLAIADSGFMVLLWRMLRGRTIARISGLKYLRILLANPRLRVRGSIFLVLPHESSREKALVWLREESFEITADDCYIAPKYFNCSHGSVSREERERVSQRRGYSIADDALVAIIEQRKPKNIIIGIGGGMQDKLGSYLKHQLSYRPAIYCIGAAPGFVTGDQVTIPMWADRFFFGWIFRIAAQPRTYLARYWKARIVAFLIKEYGREMPPLQQRFNDG